MRLHLDQFQRLMAEPASVTVVRYTPLRPFVVRVNDTGGDLSALKHDGAVGDRSPRGGVYGCAAKDDGGVLEWCPGQQ